MAWYVRVTILEGQAFVCEKGGHAMTRHVNVMNVVKADIGRGLRDNGRRAASSTRRCAD